MYIKDALTYHIDLLKHAKHSYNFNNHYFDQLTIISLATATDSCGKYDDVQILLKTKKTYLF
jgi:hypothetical protein